MQDVIHVCRSDVGMERDLNEDACICDPERGLWAVLDGMGGHGAGDLASRLAGEALIRSHAQDQALAQAIEAAHQAVLQASQKGQGAARMGCTVVVLKLQGDDYTIAWLGDCRAYLWDGRLNQLSIDHTYVQELVEAGIIDQEQASVHPKRNIVTKAIGGGEQACAAPSVIHGKAEAGQIFLLCSDGLSGELPDREIESIMALGLNEKDTADRLVFEANAKGGRDNITVSLVRVPDHV